MSAAARPRSELASTPAVSALVVTWNNEATLRECLVALDRALPPGSEILTFDNHSVDDSPLIAVSCGARGLVHDSNIGFAAGMNRLAEMAHGEVFVLVNPDVFVHPGSIAALLRHLPTARERTVVGGMLVGTDGECSPASARPFPTALSLTRWLVTRRSATWRLPAVAQDVSAVSGAFFATTRVLWCELAGFDEAYRHSGEDLDFFWRASCAGASVRFEPRAVATHVGGGSVRQAPLQIDALRVAGALRLVRKREGTLAETLVRGVLLSRSLTALALDALRIRRLSTQRRTRAHAFVSLALHGDRGRGLQLPVEPRTHA